MTKDFTSKISLRESYSTNLLVKSSLRPSSVCPWDFEDELPQDLHLQLGIQFYSLKGHSHAILVHFKNKKICPHINERPQIMV